MLFSYLTKPSGDQPPIYCSAYLNEQWCVYTQHTQQSAHSEGELQMHFSDAGSYGIMVCISIVVCPVLMYV